MPGTGLRLSGRRGPPPASSSGDRNDQRLDAADGCANRDIRKRVSCLAFCQVRTSWRSEPGVWSGNLEQTAREREHDVPENIEIILLTRDQRFGIARLGMSLQRPDGQHAVVHA